MLEKIERRRDKRFRVSGELIAQRLPFLGSLEARKAVVRGRVRNISSGGLCIGTDQPVEASSVLRGELRLSRIPVRIPVILQVRWIKSPAGRQYSIGAQFLLSQAAEKVS